MHTLIEMLPPEDLVAIEVLSALSETMDWGDNLAQVGEAHKFTRGAGITVAVLDSGIVSHPDLDVNLITAVDATGNNNTNAESAHGVHVAGIIAAAKNDIGVVGVAPEAKVFPIKVLDGSGRGTWAWVANGLRIAIDAKVDLINMSLGVNTPPPDAIVTLIQEAASKGIILVAAAGNDGGRAVSYPARLDEVIAVSAIDHNGQLAKFSNIDNTTEAVGPGVDIYSTWHNAGYALLSGTSQASPFIAGVIALLMAHERIEDPTRLRNIKDVLAMLSTISDAHGRIGALGPVGDLGFGVPSFANINWH